MRLKIYRSKVDLATIDVINYFLREEYGNVLEIDIQKDEILLPKNAFNCSRKQYNAFVLQQYLISRKDKNLALWVIREDIYWKDMNFIFGCAVPWCCAILSISRLYNHELIGKEAIHEVGHILGLNHCKNKCVMRFSNSVEEALLKPVHLCERCKKKLLKIL